MSAHISGGYAKEPPTYGKVLLHTTIGDIDIELWPKQAPKACRNFVQLAMEEYYHDCVFHRVIPNFMVQTGDPTGDGDGGESIYGIPFKDELHSRLTFSHRGVVAMANAGNANDNQSQFFITLDKTPWLNRKHTIFGKVTGDTVYNVLKFNDLQIGSDDKPVLPQKIVSVEILLNPFEDIEPRMTKTQRARVEQLNKQNEEMQADTLRKQAGAKKDCNLLAFEDDDDDDEDDDEERTHLKETKARLERIKQQKQTQTHVQDVTDGSNVETSVDGSKKRSFSQFDAHDDGGGGDGGDDGINECPEVKKQRKMQDVNAEYEALKKQLLRQQNEVDYEDEDEDEDGGDNDIDGDGEGGAKDELHGMAKLRQQREQYVQRTRLNKRERAQQSMHELDAFMQALKEKSDKKQDNTCTDQTGKKMDANTGIAFESDSDGDGDGEDYDPQWFKSTLEFKKKPQDEIFSVDDYETVYGEVKQRHSRTSSTQDSRQRHAHRKSHHEHK